MVSAFSFCSVADCRAFCYSSGCWYFVFNHAVCLPLRFLTPFPPNIVLFCRKMGGCNARSPRIGLAAPGLLY